MKITIKVYDVTKKLFFRQALGEATFPDGSKVDITNIIPTGDLHLRFNDKSYRISVADILEQIVEQRKPKASKKAKP